MLREALPKIITDLPGPKSREIIALRRDNIPSGVGCSAPCVIERGEGAMFLDRDGNIFMDWVGGIGVLNIGYSHPEVVAAVREQAGRYFHSSINVVHYEEYVRLAEKLNTIVPVPGKKKTMFVNSGAEAVENAVKIARKATGRTGIVVFTGAFHGRTSLTMTMTAKIKPYKFGMGPDTPGIYRCEYPYTYRNPERLDGTDAAAYYLQKIESFFLEYVSPENTAAIVIEPVQGEGGFIVPPIKWIQGIRKICNKHGIIMIADEVQTGYCRTGRMFASEYWRDADAAPDLVTSAKSIAGGLPISSVTGREEIMEATHHGGIGGTYCGNPLAAAAALKVIEVMERDDYSGKANRIQEVCVKRFKRWQDEFPAIGEVRSLGAMMAIEFVRNPVSREPDRELVGRIVGECTGKGLITMSAGVYGNVIRFLMPLVITEKQIEAGLEIMESAIRNSI